MFVCERDCYANKRFYRRGQTLGHRPCRHFAPANQNQSSGKILGPGSRRGMGQLTYKELLKLAKDMAKAQNLRLKSRKRADLERFCVEGE